MNAILALQVVLLGAAALLVLMRSRLLRRWISALGTVAFLTISLNALEMLRDGPYPWSVKQRVLSRVGHLSNDATAEYLQKDYDGGAAYIVLGHLSESNNVPELARLAAEQALAGHPTLLGNRIILAQQANPLEPICL